MAGVDSAGISLIKAARDGDLEQVHRLIEGGACVNAVNENDQTALMILAQHCRYSIPEMAIALINGGIDVNMKDKEGNTALMYAIAQNSEGIALAIIEHSKDLDLNAVDNQGQTALIKAAVHRKTKVAQVLIRCGADVNMKDREGKTALMYTIDFKRDSIAAPLISKSSNDFSVNSVVNQCQKALMKCVINAPIKRRGNVKVMDRGAKTALMHVIAKRDEDTALAIIEHSKDLDLNAVDNQGQTALITAVIHGKMKVAKVLIKRGADVNIKDKEGKTALMHAIAQGDEDTAFEIIEHSKDLNLNAVDNQGQTALITAVIHAKMKVAKELITRGANVNETDKKGRVALMYIGLADSNKDYNDFDAGKLTHDLIDAGADANKSDDKGNTALIYNVKNEASVRALIYKAKAPVDSKNNIGRTALFFALVESISSAKYLVENGANLHMTDNYNVSVLSYFIHHCINNGGPDKKLIEKTFPFLKDNGVKKQTIVNALVNAVFCKLPQSPINTISITSCLTYGNKLSKEGLRNSLRRDKKCSSLQKLVDSIERDRYSISVTDLSIRLNELLELGADPNTCDELGNTIAHHITSRGMHDSTVEAKSVFDVLLGLEKRGLMINKKNCKKEGPFLFMLTLSVNKRRLNREFILNMCIFFLENDRAILNDRTQTGDSVFHLLIKLSSVGDSNEESLERCIMEKLRFFSQEQRELISHIVNSTNDEMNTPLHVWAAGSQQKSRTGKRNQHASERMNWQGPSEKILDLLLSCKAVHHARNLKGETPLHMCRTWTSVKLLVKAEAKTNDVDKSGRSPLLSAAKNLLFLENPGCFYPDISPDEAPKFWETVMGMHFDLWTCDENGDSIISILIKENSFELADSLIEIACKNSQSLSDKTFGVLNAICKDESTHTTWKSILVDKVLKNLKSTRCSLDLITPLQSCCKNIKEGTKPDSVHYEIAKQLLRYGAPGESCLDIAEGCPPLHALLSTPVSMEERPFIIPWTSCSQKHKNQLAEVARGLKCNVQKPYWYHNKEIGHGAFGQVFVGIHEKDSMEVAVKRVRYTQQDRDEDIREIRSLASLPKCEHIVRYLTFLQTDEFSFIIMELMEGDLDGYFASNVYDQRQTKVFCREVALGLKYLHEQNIIHRDLKPNNILYKTDPQLCLKIADFGLSRRVDVNASFTVMTNGVGTPGWIAPEVIKSNTQDHSMWSDVFSLGLIFHYILSNKKHPFSPADCTGKSDYEINIATQGNILKNDMEGWSKSLDPESSHRVKGMLNCTNEKERPTASMLLHHPMFWSKKKKLDFLSAVGNQEEFECPRAKRTAPLTMVEQDLENVFATIVKLGKWNDPHYTQTWPIFIEMQKPIVKHDKKGKPYKVRARKYDIGSAVELVRFIRNAIAHVSEASRPTVIRTQILEDAVFLDEFPNLVIEVFKAVTAHGWDVSREEIKHVLAND